MRVSAHSRIEPGTYTALCTVLLVLLGLAPNLSLAAPDCNPQSIAGRAVGGQLLNEMLGGFNKIIGAAAGIENGLSPTPSSLMGDCIIPRLNPPIPDEPDSDPSPVRPPAGGWGDPHLITHDGLGFDFQGAGDYAYVESESLTVHARQIRLSNTASVSRLKAFAIRFDDTTVVIKDPIDPSQINSVPGLDDVITVNGEDMPIGLGGWIDLDAQGSYIMRLRSHTYLQIVGKVRMLVGHDGNTFKLLLDESLQGAVTGALGDFDGNPSNDLKTASGDSFSISDVDTLYGAFLDGWLRQGADSLFNSPFDPLTGGNIRPGEVRTLSDIALSAREAAAERCLAAGVSAGFPLHGCIYDMVFDEDIKWLADAAEITDGNFNVIPATSFGASNDTAIALESNASVFPGQPTNAAGALGVINEKDIYTITLPPGASRILNPVAPCTTAQPFSLLLLNQGNATTVEQPLVCGASIPLPPGQSTLTVFSHGGDTGDYRFNIIEPADTEIGVIALDTLIEGTLSAQERLNATLPSDAGSRVFIVSNQEQNCERVWEISDGSGVVVKRTSTCLDLGPVDIGNNTPYSLKIQPASSGTYRFTVLTVLGDTVIGPGDDRYFELNITSPAQQASAEFSLTEGDRIYVDREGGVVSGTLFVTGPESFEIVRSSPSQEDIQFEANISGIYTLTLIPEGAFTGMVPISLVSVADDINVSVSLGQTFSLALSTLGQRASASFELVEGQSLTVTATTTSTLSGIAMIPAVLRPDNVLPLAIFGSRTITAQVTGTYQVYILSTETNGFTGVVEFSLN
jgi:hypothetical protein